MYFAKEGAQEFGVEVVKGVGFNKCRMRGNRSCSQADNGRRGWVRRGGGCVSRRLERRAGWMECWELKVLCSCDDALVALVALVWRGNGECVREGEQGA